MDHQPLIWLAIASLCIILELANPGLFFFLALSAAALAAGSVAWLSYSVAAQLLTFIGTWALGFLILSKVVAQYKPAPQYATNVARLPGKRGVVLNPILYPETGTVKILGEIWSARSAQQEQLLAGCLVEVVTVVGCHVIVKQVKDSL